jgi:hypothetical protein
MRQNPPRKVKSDFKRISAEIGTKRAHVEILWEIGYPAHR